MIQQTSLLAYKDLQETLGKRQLEVYNQLKIGSATNSELSHILGVRINSITPRVYELRKKGFVERKTVRTCMVTGRKAIEWRLK